MAERRLRSVEKKLKRDKSLAQAYQSVIDDYKSKGYIREEGGKGGGHDPVSRTNFNKIHASRTVLAKFHESRNLT